MDKKAVDRKAFVRKTLTQRLACYQTNSVCEQPVVVEGRLTRVVGMTLEAVGLNVSLGQQCELVISDSKRIDAEVVGFSGDTFFLMPIQHLDQVQPGARIIPCYSDKRMKIGSGILGRVINGLGQPLDGKGKIIGEDFLTTAPELINPLQRHPISAPLDVGVRAINGLITVGQGQRMGLFAGSGVGKSVLMGMMTRFTAADVVVVGLVGERGREVKEFIEHILTPAGMRKAVVIVSPADDAPLMRLKAAQLASRVAEYFRDKGKKVLLLLDSLTRFAQAQREIALSIGEPPATKGYPASVFAKIPQLVERAGNASEDSGSITAFYTVLTEGDDLQDPVADAARAILDGHVVLSRRYAEEGIYPAIDIQASISRAMPNIVSGQHIKLMQRFKQLLARYEQSRDLLSIGAYTPGADTDTDTAIEMIPKLQQYLKQELSQAVSQVQSIKQLEVLFSIPEKTLS